MTRLFAGPQQQIMTVRAFKLRPTASDVVVERRAERLQGGSVVPGQQQLWGPVGFESWFFQPAATIGIDGCIVTIENIDCGMLPDVIR